MATIDILMGTGDNPVPAARVWLGHCGDGHPSVIYVAGAEAADGSGVWQGGCPACAAEVARLDRSLDT